MVRSSTHDKQLHRLVKCSSVRGLWLCNECCAVSSSLWGAFYCSPALYQQIAHKNGTAATHHAICHKLRGTCTLSGMPLMLCEAIARRNVVLPVPLRPTRPYRLPSANTSVAFCETQAAVKQRADERRFTEGCQGLMPLATQQHQRCMLQAASHRNLHWKTQQQGGSQSAAGWN